MRVAVTGTSGRVGAALAHFLAGSHEIIPLPRRIFDLADASALGAALDDLDCDVFINPAAITSLEICEDDPDLATRVNAEAPGQIAEWAAGRGVKVFHFSTDYVFDGEMPGLRGEWEIASPINEYGCSKLAGEQAVLAFPENCVVRVSWVFGPERTSFVDDTFDNALAGKPLAAVADKFSLPAFTGDLAKWMGRLIDHRTTGIVHACNSGEPASWHDLATLVVDEMTAAGVLHGTHPIERRTLDSMTSFRAPRPRFTALDCQRLAGILGERPRPWREALAEYVRRRCSRL